MTCESCEPQFFPYLYDLLDPVERQGFESHLRDCPHCEQGLERARSRRADIAVAVKSSFPDVVFATPRPQLRAPRPAPRPRVPRRPLLFTGWGMAATVLFTVLTAGVVGAWCISHYQGVKVDERQAALDAAMAQRDLADRAVRAKQANVEQDIQNLKAEINRLLGDWDQQVQKTHQDPKQKRVVFEIRGPRTAQAGATNRYDIQVKPTNPQQPVKVAKLRAEVINEKTKNTVFTKALTGGGRAKLELPPDLAVRPGDDLTLVLHADVDGGPAQVREQLALEFPDYVTYLSTDRPMYRPGEVVHFRSLTLERFSLKPAADDFTLRYRITASNNVEVFKKDISTRLVAGKDKDRVQGPDGQPLRGIGAGDFTLPKHLPGGVYTLSVSELSDRFPEERRTFIVHRWQTPYFNKEIEFGRASYGPGENVSIRGKVSRLGQPAGMMGMAGGVMAAPGGMLVPPAAFGQQNIRINATAVVDNNNQLFGVDRDVEIDGSFAFDFSLPANLTQGNGVITLQFSDNGGGAVETVVRNIPIVLRDVLIDFYPEGGDLVVGVPNRVYFQARTGAYKPVAVRGSLLERGYTLDKQGREKLEPQAREIGRIETFSDDKEPGLNAGLGIVTFTPQAKKRYQVRLDTPVGNAKPYSLPAPKSDGVVLRLPQGVVAKDIPVTVYSATRDRELLVGAYCRGKLLDSTAVTARAGAQTDLTLHPAVEVGGVHRVTVFEKKPGGAYQPVAERLIYRKQTAQLHVALRPERSEYAPGETVRLDLAATNEQKQFVPSVVMCAIVDSSVLKLAGDKTECSMPAHFLLTSEIHRPEDLENSDALLNESNPRAAEALDLLLGTQGWRRFAEQDPQKFTQRQQQSGRPSTLLAASMPVPRFSASGQKTLDEVDQKFVGEFVSLQDKLDKKERDYESVPELQQKGSAESAVAAAGTALSSEQQRYNELWGFFMQAAFGAAVGLLVFFGFFLVATSLYRLAEGKGGYILLGGGLVLLVFLFMVSLLGTFLLIGTPMENNIFFNNGRVGMFGGRAMVATTKAPMVPGQNMPQLPRDPRWEQQLPGEAEQGIEQPQVLGPDGMPAEMPNQNVGPNVMMPQDIERQLRQQGKYQELLQRRLGRKVNVPPPVDAGAVREFAHQHKAEPSQIRRDFADTLYWQPALVLRDGQGQVRFDLSDSVTSFRVLAVSHSLDGRLGTDSIEIAARLPYQIEPKVPVEIAASDQVEIPVVVRNDSAAQTDFQIKLLKSDGLRSLDNGGPVPRPANKPLTLKPGESQRELFRFRPTVPSGKALVRLQGKFARGNDTVQRSFIVAPDGFPVTESLSGTLEGTVAVSTGVNIPSDKIAGSLVLEARAYPSILADLQQSADALLREPHGCFEQASSSNYPNVLILNYLQDTRQANPVVENRARALMDQGYERLVTFECIAPDNPKDRRGFEWFGETAPPHEALTAYALLEFNEMARVYPVDKAMLERTRKYLLDQRDGKGGFKRNARSVDQFGRAPEDITNAYITWALTEAGAGDELATELGALYEQGKKSNDPYLIALAGLSQLKAGRNDPGLELLRRLRTFQRGTGEVAGARTSITSSADRDLLIETTALAALGWLRADLPADFQNSAHKAGQWLLRQRSGSGGFGATQSTVLALKALIAFAGQKQNQKAIQATDLRVEITHASGQRVSGEARIVAGMIEPITIRLKEKIGEEKSDFVLAPGANQIDVHLTEGNNRLPFTLSWSYRTRKPVGSLTPVQISTRLDQDTIKEGDTVKLHVEVQNRTGQDQGMTMAVVGLPAGLALPDDLSQLKELTRLARDGKPGRISAWEMNGSRELVLYWRGLKANAKVELELDLVGRLPGIYSGPASRAYLYYNAEHKHWVDPLHVTVHALP
jgi:hypothetical protein